MNKNYLIAIMACVIAAMTCQLAQAEKPQEPHRMGEKEGWLSAPALINSKYLKTQIIEARLFGIAAK